MIILEEVYNRLISEVPYPPPETGGMLGIKDDIIVECYIDNSIKHHCCYIPDVKKLNEVIKEWYSEDISFGGIFHTHFSGGESLSCEDIDYINKIMADMPDYITKLYFPLLFPKEKLIAYFAEKFFDNVVIKRDEIKIV